MLDLNGHSAIRDLVETELRRRGEAWDLHVVEAVLNQKPDGWTGDQVATHALIALRDLQREGRSVRIRDDWDRGLILYRWKEKA